MRINNNKLLGPNNLNYIVFRWVPTIQKTKVEQNYAILAYLKIKCSLGASAD